MFKPIDKQITIKEKKRKPTVMVQTRVENNLYFDLIRYHMKRKRKKIDELERRPGCFHFKLSDRRGAAIISQRAFARPIGLSTAARGESITYRNKNLLSGGAGHKACKITPRSISRQGSNIPLNRILCRIYRSTCLDDDRLTVKFPRTAAAASSYSADFENSIISNRRTNNKYTRTCYTRSRPFECLLFFVKLYSRSRMDCRYNIIM